MGPRPRRSREPSTWLLSPAGSPSPGVTCAPRIPADVWFEYPAWSPDGTRIAFMGQTPEGTENYEIYVMNADGTGRRRLTDSPASDGFPSWSPDGTKIAFTSTRDDCSMSEASDCKTTGDIGPYHTLYVMNADGSGVLGHADRGLRSSLGLRVRHHARGEGEAVVPGDVHKLAVAPGDPGHFSRDHNVIIVRQAVRGHPPKLLEGLI